MIYNEDCISGSKKYIKSESVDLGIFDPPFGIKETKFDQLYNRDKNNIINGYIEAPSDYYSFSKEWISEAKRILKPNGSMYIISGWSNLRHILNAINDLDLIIINHIIWKFNFGIATKSKFVTSHYHILYLKKINGLPVFNTYCRFGSQEKNENNKSLNYQDLEDVFIINKEYSPNQVKNQNKLPNSLIEKLILYSSKENDLVCDFFMGNFTTAMVAKKLGRKVIGFELNKESYDYWYPQFKSITNGCDLPKLKQVINKSPSNSGKKISDIEYNNIIKDFVDNIKELKTKKETIKYLSNKYGRGYFSIINILKKANL